MENKNNNYQSPFQPPIDVTKKQKKHLFRFNKNKIKKFFTTKPSKKNFILLGGIAVVLIGGSLSALTLFGPKPVEPNPEPVVTSNYVPPAPTTVASPLTGVQVEPELAERAVTGVMIENSIDARPQSGLRDAGVVFEAIAEGGITRFLALFQEARPDYIGPIRSARPYYVQWAAGFDAAYVHSGGSPEALLLIRRLGVNDLDHANNGGSFDRVSNRYAPHNVYTSMDRLDDLRKSKGFDSSDFKGFDRIEPTKDKSEEEAETTDEHDPATKIEFTISGPLYNTSYSYNKDSNTYARVLAGQPHTDEKSGKQIKPSVVIALVTEYDYHSDGVHSVYKTVGKGSVLVFQNGTVEKGTWRKDSADGRLKFTNANDEPLALTPGQTWITAIPKGKVSYTP